MIKKLILLFLSFLIVIMESTLISRFRIGGIIPNLTLITVMSIALCEDSKTGRQVGFFMGLTQDVLFFRSIGHYALLYFFLGHISGIARRVLHRSNLTTLFLFIMAGDLIYGLIIDSMSLSLHISIRHESRTHLLVTILGKLSLERCQRVILRIQSSSHL